MKPIALLLLCASCKQNKPPPMDQVELHDTFGCVHLVDGKRACFGELPNGTTTLLATMYAGPILPTKPNPTRADVPGLTGVAEVANGAHHTCARLENGLVACWGDNAHHQLADGSTASRPTPAVVPGLTGVIAITAAGDATCVLKGKEARCWGANDHGQLGDGTKTEHSVPTPLRFAPLGP